MSTCIPCENNENKLRDAKIEKVKEKATAWAAANEYHGWLVIIQEGGSIKAVPDDCPCLATATEIERLHFD